ncbi:hypothetical protein ACT8ZR_18270 [Neobacillus sp. M.A.Huq-85]
MNKFQVNIGLNNGKEYSFFAFKETQKEVFNAISNQVNDQWYSFIDLNGLNVRWVNKNEIASISVSLTPEQMEKHQDDIDEKEKSINK